MLALFEQYSRLAEKIPHVDIGEFPTPVQKMGRLGATIRTPNLSMKCEDLSGKLYGGNKWAHMTRMVSVLVIAALMVLGPF